MTAAFDSLVADLDGPLMVVTAASTDQRGGCVVGFHTQCSIDPVRYAVWLSKANHTYRVALFAQHVAVHFLAAGDHDLAELFGGSSGDVDDKFAHCEWTPGPSGVPLLTRCPNRVVLERVSMWDDGSDHVCLIGAVVDARSVGFTPMRLSDANDIDAGHEAEERATPDSLTAPTDEADDVDEPLDPTSTTDHRGQS